MVRKLNLGGVEYTVEVGTLLNIPSASTDYGKWVKFAASDYEFTAFRVHTIDDVTGVYRIDEIIYTDENGAKVVINESTNVPDVQDTTVLELETKDEQIKRLGKLKKSELLEEAKKLGIEVPDKAKKSEIISILVEG